MEAFGYTWTSSMEGGRTVATERPWMRFSEEAAWKQNLDDDNSIVLSVVTSPKDVRHWDGKTYKTKYAVGLIRSVDTFGYGTYSAKIKLPHGNFLWPSFWLVGDGRWPDNGEIDIMEAWSDKRGSYFKALLPKWNTTNNVHYLKNGEHNQIKPCCVPWIIQTSNPADKFVEYRVEYKPDSIVFKANNTVVRRISGNVMRCLPKEPEMHVIFNLWTDNEDFSLDSPMIVKDFKYNKKATI